MSNLGQPLFCLSITWSRCRNACRDLWIMAITRAPDGSLLIWRWENSRSRAQRDLVWGQLSSRPAIFVYVWEACCRGDYLWSDILDYRHHSVSKLDILTVVLHSFVCEKFAVCRQSIDYTQGRGKYDDAEPALCRGRLYVGLPEIQIIGQIPLDEWRDIP